jgi:hypothetical protein
MNLPDEDVLDDSPGTSMPTLKRVTHESAWQHNPGIHNSTSAWRIIGPLGTVEFALSEGYPLMYHSPVALYPRHVPTDGRCEVIGSVCYHGYGPYLHIVLPIINNEKVDGAWRFLEAYYHDVFIEGPLTVEPGYEDRLWHLVRVRIRGCVLPRLRDNVEVHVEALIHNRSALPLEARVLNRVWGIRNRVEEEGQR